MKKDKKELINKVFDGVSQTITKQSEKLFHSLWDVAQELPVDINQYHNGTGYFDRLKIDDIDLPEKGIFRATDKHGRKVLVLVLDPNHTGAQLRKNPYSEEKRWVIFQRYYDSPKLVCQNYKNDLANIMDILYAPVYYGPAYNL